MLKILLALALTGPFDGYLQQSFESTGVPGMAAVVTHGDQVVYAGGFGRDVTADTPMRVASVSKSFTSAAVESLAEQGRVDLDQAVTTYLPEFRMADERASRITVRQLLDQTSGLSDRTVDIGATQRAANLTEYVAALRDGRLHGEPGTRFEYCNVNFDVAARLVEVVDGRPFAEALRARVFEPLGMTSSSVGDDVPDGQVSLYGAWVSRAEMPGFRGGAGGVVTTASDMGRWLIDRAAGIPRTPGASYSMGWGEEEVAGRKLLVHSGNLFTYTAVQAVDPATGHGYAVLTNNASLRDDTYDILLGLVALDDGRTPEVPGGERQLIELGLAVAALVALGLGALGVVRSGRRRWTIPRLLWLLLPVTVFATYPQWVSFLTNGREVTWEQMTYFALPLTITLGCAATAATATLVARLRSFR